MGSVDVMAVDVTATVCAITGVRAAPTLAQRIWNTLADSACSSHINSLAPAVALPAPRHDRRRTGAAGSPPGGFPFLKVAFFRARGAWRGPSPPVSEQARISSGSARFPGTACLAQFCSAKPKGRERRSRRQTLYVSGHGRGTLGVLAFAFIQFPRGLRP